MALLLLAIRAVGLALVVTGLTSSSVRTSAVATGWTLVLCASLYSVLAPPPRTQGERLVDLPDLREAYPAKRLSDEY